MVEKFEIFGDSDSKSAKAAKYSRLSVRGIFEAHSAPTELKYFFSKINHI